MRGLVYLRPMVHKRWQIVQTNERHTCVRLRVNQEDRRWDDVTRHSDPYVNTEV